MDTGANAQARIRFKRLNQVWNRALQQSVHKIQNWDKIVSCFPAYASTEVGSSNLANCQKQAVEFWMQLCRYEFEEICRERDVETKLNDLDDLVDRAKTTLQSTDKDTPRICIDQLDPHELVDGNLNWIRRRSLDELSDRILKLEAVNETLTQELQETQTAISQQLSQLDRIFDTHLGSENQGVDDTLRQGLLDLLLERKEGQDPQL
ncbi:LAMI_0C05336g1_1 [Lachancea mirantina]|uniref:Kinetochore-associated protein n=1 Tax=Lachancea mirantina TaxID=1230905 RepID=A0A1G4J2K3_9SACH|nr:LAMI_0C05336g1_1 [Lachancea mirantina]